VTAAFVTSAAAADGLPRDGLPEVVLVGRSNVGKSSLINALVRQRLARTSAAPGKTRLANVYRVERGASGPFYLIDLPGYGYARGGDATGREFAALTTAYFERAARRADHDEPVGCLDLEGPCAILLVDTRHPGLPADRAAWAWLQETAAAATVVGTKIDKLPRGQRIRAVRELESVFETSVLPVSAETGEGLDELWKLIDRLLSSRKPQPRRPPRPLPRATAPRPQRPSGAEGQRRPRR
jgi:GTP-binding protein